MNDDLLRELAEIKNDIKGLNERLDRVTDKVIEATRNEIIDNNPISLEKTINQLEQDLTNGYISQEHIPQPYPQQFTPISNQKFKQERPKPKKSPRQPRVHNGDLETNIGKNVMGVLASLLIFIGIVSFVAFIFTDLSEIAKLILMYLFSFALFGIGLWRVEKNKNGFSLSLSGCGIGAVFISILLSYFYFGILTSQLLLFALLISWSAIVLILSKRYKSDIFVIISYIGYLMALLLGALSGMVLVGDSICTVSIMIILHSIFIFLIGSKRIPISERFYKIYPFLSLLGSLLLLFCVFDENYFVYSFIEIESLLLILAIFSQMFANLYYIYKLKGLKDIKQSYITIVLLLTCFINILGFWSTSLNYYTRNHEDRESFFYSLVEEPKEQLNGAYYDPNTNSISGNLVAPTINPVEVTDEGWVGISMLFAAIVQFGFIEWLKLKERFNKGRNIVLYCLTVFIGLVLACDPMFRVLNGLIGFVIPATILLLYGRNDKHIFKMSLILYFIGLFVGCMINDMSYLKDFISYYWIFAVVNLIYLVLTGFVLKKNYSLGNKVWYYIISVLGLLFLTNIFGDYYSNIISDSIYKMVELEYNSAVFIQDYDFYDMLHDNPWYSFFNYEFATFLIYIVLSIYGLFAKLSGYGQNWNNIKGLKKSTKEDLDIVYNLNNGLNCIMLLMGVTLIHNIEIGWLQFILILMTSLQCFIGSRELLSRDKQIIDYYVGIKSTIFINVVMGAFVDSGMGYIYSIVCLLIAVSSIVIGFKSELKSFRFYGLILSICSVLKLVLIDINYDNSLGRIFSFISAGLICFMIVWIYNRMSEKLK